MRIRDAEIKDAAAIAALLGELGYPGTEDFCADKIARIAAHPDARLLVAQAGDGGVQGFIGLHFIVQLALPGDFCRITYFCVSEAARGLGVGRELEETAARLARARLRPHRGALPRAPRRRAPFLLPPGV